MYSGIIQSLKDMCKVDHIYKHKYIDIMLYNQLAFKWQNISFRHDI